MRVLFVEDSEVNRRVIQEMLRAGGIEMSEAEDGVRGLEAIDVGDYDLILMDLRMPGMDGLTAIRHIRARTDHKANLPVIVITADDGFAETPDFQIDCRQYFAQRRHTEDSAGGERIGFLLRVYLTQVVNARISVLI